MTWFLALQGPAHISNQSSNHQLQESVDVERLAQELTSAATLDRIVPIPAVLASPRRQDVTLYVRPAAWGAWMFFQLSDEDQQQMRDTLSALARAAQQQRAGQPGQPGQPITVQTGPGHLGPLGNRP